MHGGHVMSGGEEEEGERQGVLLQSLRISEENVRYPPLPPRHRHGMCLSSPTGQFRHWNVYAL